MKKISLILTAALLCGTALAQRPEADKIETIKGPLAIQPIFHGSIVFTWNGKTIYVDPYNGAKSYEGQAAPDLILITDIHPDHLDPKTLETINTLKAKLVVPQAVMDQLPENLKGKAIVVANGKSTIQEEVEITAVPMYNLPEGPQTMHTKGRGNGYVLGMGGKRIYISGDTEDIPEMRSLKNIDVAFVCMNMPYTMEVSQAAEGVLAFKPKVVYPYHYRGKDGLSDIVDFKKRVDDGKKGIDVRLRDWYHPED